MNSTEINAWKQLKNIGPVMAPLLVEAGISVDDLQALTVEDVFMRFWQHHQKPRFVHSAYLYALHGAKYNIDWRALSEADRQRYKRFCKDFKESW